MYPQSRAWAVSEGAGADGVGSNEMQAMGAGGKLRGEQAKKEVRRENNQV